MKRNITITTIILFLSINCSLADTIMFKYKEWKYETYYDKSEKRFKPILGVFYKDGVEIAREVFIHDNPSIEGEIPDGEVIMYFENGKYRGISNYKKNLLHGKYISYYHNGKINYVANYVNGKRDGICKSYNSKGKLSSKAKYSMGKRVGFTYKVTKAINKGAMTIIRPFAYVGMLFLGFLGIGRQ
ncbi:MAG: hypothetical protein JW871_04040 [Endomicrobiales bacterium]|nr:hypothetical protein [Endomicrobiales bacterium]